VIFAYQQVSNIIAISWQEQVIFWWDNEWWCLSCTKSACWIGIS